MKALNLSTLPIAPLNNGGKKMAKYLIISQAIRDAIKNGKVKSLEQLPSARQLALQLNTNRHTIMAAFNELIAQGWIVSQQRKGYFVAEDLPVNGSVKTKPIIQNELNFEWEFTKNVESSPIQSVDNIVIISRVARRIFHYFLFKNSKVISAKHSVDLT